MGGGGQHSGGRSASHVADNNRLGDANCASGLNVWKRFYLREKAMEKDLKIELRRNEEKVRAARRRLATAATRNFRLIAIIETMNVETAKLFNLVRRNVIDVIEFHAGNLDSCVTPEDGLRLWAASLECNKCVGPLVTDSRVQRSRQLYGVISKGTYRAPKFASRVPADTVDAIMKHHRASEKVMSDDRRRRLLVLPASETWGGIPFVANATEVVEENYIQYEDCMLKKRCAGGDYDYTSEEGLSLHLLFKHVGLLGSPLYKEYENRLRGKLGRDFRRYDSNEDVTGLNILLPALQELTGSSSFDHGNPSVAPSAAVVCPANEVAADLVDKRYNDNNVTPCENPTRNIAGLETRVSVVQVHPVEHGCLRNEGEKTVIGKGDDGFGNLVDSEEYRPLSPRILEILDLAPLEVEHSKVVSMGLKPLSPAQRNVDDGRAISVQPNLQRVDQQPSTSKRGAPKRALAAGELGDRATKRLRPSNTRGCGDKPKHKTVRRPKIPDRKQVREEAKRTAPKTPARMFHYQDVDSVDQIYPFPTRTNVYVPRNAALRQIMFEKCAEDGEDLFDDYLVWEDFEDSFRRHNNRIHGRDSSDDGCGADD